jgi:hypothetical protein
MTDYIKRSDACAEVDRGDLLVGDNASWAKECINRTSSADVAELKHGSWTLIDKQHGNETEGFWTERYLQCSECNYERRHTWIKGERPNFCEGCGADMRGE